MSKKKDSRALFELITRSKDKHVEPKLGVPDWMARQPEQHQPQAAPPALERPPVPSKPPAIGKPPAVGKPPKRKGGPAEAILTWANNRVKLSVSYLTATATGAGVLVLLLGAFWLGWSAAPRGAKEVASSDNGGKHAAQTSGKEAGTGAGKKPRESGNGGPAASGLEEGKHYLVVQTLQGSGEVDLADARKIQEFCTTKGLPVRIMRYTPPAGGKTRYMVWAMKPFEIGQITSPEAVKLAAEVEKLGEEYSRKTSGRYSFKQGKDPRGRVEGWFLPFRKGR